MEKLVYLTWKPTTCPIAEYRRHLLDEVSPRLLDAGVLALNVSVADTQDTIPKATLLMGEGKTLSAALGMWVHCLDDRGPLEAALRERADRVDGYLVTESVPQRQTGRNWKDGEPSPGVTHFTWFPKPERLTDEAFYHGWHEIHTPASFELHPTRWEYVRNVVTRTLTPGSPRVDAIVAERFSIEDYCDPKRLYGSKQALQDNIEHLPLYADMESLNSTPLSEVIVKRL